MSLDAPSEQLQNEIRKARRALVKTAKARSENEWWYAFELKDQARNGWSAGAMNIAFRGLVKEQVFEVEGDRIRLHR